MENKKGVYKFKQYRGRSGAIGGLFISTNDKVDMLIESEIEVYFGEVLGKHSEVYGSISKDDIILVSDNEEVIKVIEQYDLTSGLNPFHYTSINFKLEGEGDLDEWSIDDIIEKIIKSKKYEK